MARNNPEIIIEHNRFLQPVFTGYWKGQAKSDWEPKTNEELERMALEKAKLWKSFEEKILSGLQEIFKLTFREDFISVHLVSGYYGAFSDPLVMSIGIPDERFVQTLAHELIHRLITFNKEKISTWPIIKKVTEGLGDEVSWVHVIVHAGMIALFRDILGEEKMLKDEIEFNKKFDGYREAWEVVEERGHQEILDQFISHY